MRKTQSRLQARLLDLSHAFCGSNIDKSDFKMRKECYDAIKHLRSNDKIIITKPDKGSGVVILDYDDYVRKMTSILQDTSKFVKIGASLKHDKTAAIEGKLRRRVGSLCSSGDLPQSIADRIRPKGTQRPRLYGLPKTHKPNVPLRPILSMVGSAQHVVAQVLTEMLEPVLTSYSQYCVKDTFKFVELIREQIPSTNANFLCSFDIKSLFTNVPLDEVIAICANTLYATDTSIVNNISKSLFIELMETATKNVEFSFDNTMYRQIDGVAMGSPLGPILANIFVGHCEAKLFSYIDQPVMYVRYVDDIFCIFRDEPQAQVFNQHLNKMHHCLSFTTESEHDNQLAFLDVLIQRVDESYVTSVYRKPTFSGQYTHWESFTSRRRKTNLIATLTDRALRICSPSTLDDEVNKIKTIFEKNGYPLDVINSVICAKLKKSSHTVKQLGPKKCRIYMRLPYIGNISNRFDKEISRAVGRCFGQVDVCTHFSSQAMLPRARKDPLPALSKSNVIYGFVCHCGSAYVGRTSHRLRKRMNEHVPSYFRKRKPNQAKPSKRKYSSAIAEHLCRNEKCGEKYSDDMFSVIARGRNAYHLSVLEACFIKSRSPILCKQKFIYKTLLPLL